MTWTLRALLMCLGLAGTAPASAHATSTSFLSVDVASGAAPVTLRWDLSVHDIVWTVFIDGDFDGAVTWGEIQAARSTIESAVLHEITVARGGVACALGAREVALAERFEQNYLSVLLEARCPKDGRLAVGGALFMQGDASQRVLLSATRGEEQLTGVISASTPQWEEPERVSAWRSFARFVGEGVWHVLIGYDHIAFVLLLILPSVLRPVGGKWQGQERFRQVARDLVTIVTAFTIAHSITLALAVTGTVILPTQPIEVAIAASIAVAAAINLLPGFSRARLPLAFGFGLVHGFGFANALAEVDARGTNLLPLLGGFNIGVEIAQLGIVAVVLPLIFWMRSRAWYSSGVMPFVSCALGAAGVVWVVQRV
jgi:hypothetical protein